VKITTRLTTKHDWMAYPNGMPSLVLIVGHKMKDGSNMYNNDTQVVNAKEWIIYENSRAQQFAHGRFGFERANKWWWEQNAERWIDSYLRENNQ
jgi:hypothetical protein